MAGAVASLVYVVLRTMRIAVKWAFKKYGKFDKYKGLLKDTIGKGEKSETKEEVPTDN